jgi:hypothetical protein
MLNSDTSIPLSRALRAIHAKAACLAARAEDYRRAAIAAETEAHRIIANAERAEAQRRVSGRSRKGVALSQRSTVEPQESQSSGLPISGPRLVWMRP